MTAFDMTKIFVGVTDTPGPYRLAVTRLPKVREAEDQLYQIINRCNEVEARHGPFDAEQTMVALLKILDAVTIGPKNMEALNAGKSRKQ